MKTVKQTVYKAEDGQIFEKQDECAKYEEVIKKRKQATSYWAVFHNPDLTEGRGYSGLTLVECFFEGYTSVELLMQDWCYRTFGRPVEFVMGVAPIQNWGLREIDRDKFLDKTAHARIGDYDYPAMRVSLSLVTGEKEQGLVIDVEAMKKLDKR